MDKPLEQLNATVLLVDDDKFLLDMYSLKFKKYGLTVSVANNGQEAITKLKDGPKPNILIIDIIMPGMDGLDTLAEMKKQHLVDDSIIVVLTNQGEPSDVDRAKALGIHGYIVKATSVPSEVVENVINIYKRNKGNS
jgi:CheY-like chemotaxis protein